MSTVSNYILLYTKSSLDKDLGLYNASYICILTSYSKYCELINQLLIISQPG